MRVRVRFASRTRTARAPGLRAADGHERCARSRDRRRRRVRPRRGRARDSTPVDLMAQASLRALEDAGLRRRRRRRPVRRHDAAADGAAQPRRGARHRSRATATRRNIGGSSFMAHVDHARAAIAAGAVRGRADRLRLDAALVGRAQRVGRRSSTRARRRTARCMPVTAYALAASRHMHEFGTTREQLAEVAVAARRVGAAEPEAPGRATRSRRGRARRADGLRPADRARLLPGHRRRRARSSSRRAERARDAAHGRPCYVLGAGEAHTPPPHHRHARPRRRPRRCSPARARSPRPA